MYVPLRDKKSMQIHYIVLPQCRANRYRLAYFAFCQMLLISVFIALFCKTTKFAVFEKKISEIFIYSSQLNKDSFKCLFGKSLQLQLWNSPTLIMSLFQCWTGNMYYVPQFQMYLTWKQHIYKITCNMRNTSWSRAATMTGIAIA